MRGQPNLVNMEGGRQNIVNMEGDNKNSEIGLHTVPSICDFEVDARGDDIGGRGDNVGGGETIFIWWKG